METRDSVPISRIGECKSNTCHAAQPNGIFLHGYGTLDYIAKRACIITPCVRQCDPLLRGTLYADTELRQRYVVRQIIFKCGCDACDVSRYYLHRRLDFRFNPDESNRAVPFDWHVQRYSDTHAMHIYTYTIQYNTYTHA